jgi:hypothetical protein
MRDPGGTERHSGMIILDGDTTFGRAYMLEPGRSRDGRERLNYTIYHDRYQRTGDGWKFTERVYEVRYEDTMPLAGSPPPHSRASVDPPATGHSRGGGTPATMPAPLSPGCPLWTMCALVRHYTAPPVRGRTGTLASGRASRRTAW